MLRPFIEIMHRLVVIVLRHAPVQVHAIEMIHHSLNPTFNPVFGHVRSLSSRLIAVHAARGLRRAQAAWAAITKRGKQRSAQSRQYVLPTSPNPSLAKHLAN